MLNPKQDAWDINENDFPAHGSAADKWHFLVRYAVLAPSTRNSQPWMFRLNGDALDLYADRSRELPAIDPRGRELVISCGAALFLLRVALERFECAAKVTLLPRYGDGDLLARLEFEPDKRVPRELRALFPAIQNRRTQRMPFDERKLPDELLLQLQADAHAEGIGFQRVDDENLRKAVAGLVAKGDRAQAGSGTFRRQLAGLFRSNISMRRDGMPGYSHGLGWLRSLLMPRLIEKGGWGEDVAEDDFMAVMYAPALVILTAREDKPMTWLAVGQGLARILLRACNAGVSASFFGQVMEIPPLRQKLAETLGEAGHPQLLLRLGYGADTEATPRRPVRDVLGKTGI
jgi:hypothetical protein